MKFTGDISVPAPRDAVYAKVRDARFFASCVEGVQDLNEIDSDHYTAVLETKVAYLKFKFNVAVEVTRADPPQAPRSAMRSRPRSPASWAASASRCCAPKPRSWNGNSPNACVRHLRRQPEGRANDLNHRHCRA